MNFSNFTTKAVTVGVGVSKIGAMIVTPIICIVIAIGLFVFGGIFSAKDASFVTTTAIAIQDADRHVDADNDTSYDIVVEYVVDGTPYRTTVSCDGTARTGDEFEISYNPENPSECGTGFGIVKIVFPIAGGVMILIAVASFFRGLRMVL